MRSLNEFTFLGRVGRINAFEKCTKVTIATDRPYKDSETGEWKDATDWVEVTIWNEGTRGYIAEKVGVGDLVLAQGRAASRSYDKDGETIYTVDFTAERFGLIAKKAEAPAEEEQPRKRAGGRR